MTVGELRKALEGLDDAMDVCVRATEESEEGDIDFIGGVASASAEYGCTDYLSFVIDASADVHPTRDGDEEE